MELIAAAHVDSPFEFAFPPVDTAARQLVLLEHATLGYEGKPPVLAQRRLGHSGGRSHRTARAERRGQVHAAESDRGHARAARGQALGGAELEARLFRAAPGRAIARGIFAVVAPAADRARRARAGAARLPGRLRLSRRHGHVGSGPLLRRREGAADARAHRPAEAEPAAARRAHQPSRHRNARSADRGAAGFRRRAGRRRARPPSAARDHRRAVARRRRQDRAVRRRPRRLSRLGVEPAPARARRARNRDAADSARRSQGAEARGGRGAPAAGGFAPSVARAAIRHRKGNGRR